MDDKPKLLDQFWQQIRLKHYSIHAVPVHCEWPLLAVLCRSSLWRALVKSNENDWSAGIQLPGQWSCKWVVKSMQLGPLGLRDVFYG